MPRRKVRIYLGPKCIFCGHVFAGWEKVHPPTIEFINGYPCTCRKVGTSPWIKDDEDTSPWLDIAYREEWEWFAF